MFYVIEFQTGTTGAVIPFAFDNQPDAESKYHTLLAVAAKSGVPKHGVMLCDENLRVMKLEVYPHPAEVEE